MPLPEKEVRALIPVAEPAAEAVRSAPVPVVAARHTVAADTAPGAVVVLGVAALRLVPFLCRLSHLGTRGFPARDLWQSLEFASRQK